MKIAILGAGKMGSFFSDILSFEHEVGIFEPDVKRLRFTYNCIRMSRPEELKEFDPELVINAVTIKYTKLAFDQILPFIGNECILSDIASVKTGLKDYYAHSGHPFASTHPMFGPTFANLGSLSTENAIIIKESCEKGKKFFRKIYQTLGLNIFDYTFEEHDETTAYSLSIPFASTLAFASIIQHQDAPGTTFKKHMEIAKGLLSEDDYLITEILFNPNTPKHLKGMISELEKLLEITEEKDHEKMKNFLETARKNIK